MISAWKSVGWNYLSIPKLQRFISHFIGHLITYLGLQLIQVSESDTTPNMYYIVTIAMQHPVVLDRFYDESRVY